MPELPEVETVRRGLERLIVDRVFRSVDVSDAARWQANPSDSQHFLVGAHPKAVRRMGKLLLIDLSSNYSLAIHLKMTGQLVYRGDENFGAGHPTASLIGELPDRSTRITFEFTDNSRLYFNDQRRFGWIKLIPTAEIQNLPFVQKLGPEPLAPETDAKIFITRIRRRNRSQVKAALLDQSVIAGVGNIYADESLWHAQIHPERRVESLSDQDLARLFDKIGYVLQLSLDHGGSTDRNYVDAEGRRGSFLQFAEVFRRQGQPCSRCGHEIIKIRVAGRGTHLCPYCQKASK